MDKRQFSKEFKEEAVRLASAGDRKVGEVAQNLGVRADLLSRWKREYRLGGGEAFPGKGKLKPKDEEIHQLQKELTDTRMERDILKKAVAIFSRQPK